MIHVVTVSFSNARQLGHCLSRFEGERRRTQTPLNHWVVSGHYPLNKEANEKEIRVLAKGYDTFYLDPGKDLGSAQTQNYLIDKIEKSDNDYIVNLDPDSACDVPGWLEAMYEEMELDPRLAMIHLTNPYVWERIRFGYHPFKMQVPANRNRPLAIPMAPEQFNITMYRYSWLKEIGGILQGSPLYGNVEGLMWQKAREMGLYSGYLLNYIEAYDLKRFEDPALWEWKRSHCHADRFFVPQYDGSFEEFCRWKGYL